MLQSIQSVASSLWNARHTKPELFTDISIALAGKVFNVLRRTKVVAVTTPTKKFLATLNYADQNPLGYSKEALQVRGGERKPSDIGWLWLQEGKNKWWLAKVIGGKVEVLKDGTYNKEQRTITLK